MKLLFVVGARPEWIKHAALSQALTEHEQVLVNTGQHYDFILSDTFIQELGIQQDQYYNLHAGSGTHAKQTAKLLCKLERPIQKEQPDLVVVYGDTNTTLAAALVASKLNVPIAHVEAGLRSHDRTMPEEVNRVMVDHLSDYLFTPTDMALFNLMNEGLSSKAYPVGDVMVDTLHWFRKKAEASQILDVWGLEPQEYRVLTIHRQSNSNRASLHDILTGVEQSDIPVVFPAHPRISQILAETGAVLKSNIKVIEPLGYLDMVKLMSNADKIITDSGGMQKEAYMLGVPCVTLRENTEWTETLNGWNVLVGSNSRKIADALNNGTKPKHHPVLYQAGACGKIATVVGMIV